jgi:DNA topoisomerase-1
VMNDFYRPFNKALEEISSREEQIRDSLLESTDEECPLCGKKLVVKWGRLGRYMACEDYPECRFTKTADKDTDHIEEKCELCGREMIVRAGRFGRFVACSGYPQCKNSKPFKIGMKCPKDECDGDVIERKSRRGSLFYGCSRYPDCDFISSHRPVPKTCPTCGNNFLQKRYTQAKGEHLKCPKCKDEFAEDMTRVDELSTES